MDSKGNSYRNIGETLAEGSIAFIATQTVVRIQTLSQRSEAEKAGRVTSELSVVYLTKDRQSQALVEVTRTGMTMATEKSPS